MADNILGFKFPKNRQKWSSMHILASANELETNDVIENSLIGVAPSLARRHWSSGIYYL